MELAKVGMLVKKEVRKELTTERERGTIGALRCKGV